MSIKMRRAKAPAITVDGKYWAEILSVNSCETKNGNRKAILELRPYDFETGRKYRKIEVWIDTEEEKDSRVGSLLDALPEECEHDLEEAVGHAVGLEITINVSLERTFVNVTDFFEVLEEENESDEDLNEEDDFIQSDTIKTSNNKKSSRR